MDSNAGALSLTRGQLDIWLAEETGRSGAKWHLGMLGRIEGIIEHGLLEQAVRQVIHEAEPLRAVFPSSTDRFSRRSSTTRIPSSRTTT